MAMEHVNSELSVTWHSGAQINYVDNVVAEPSEGGVVEPVGVQSRPLLRMTFDTNDAAAARAMFGTTRSGRKSFLIRVPVDAYSKVTNATLGTATGLAQDFTLKIALGTLEWDADYAVESTIIVYDNGTPISDSVWSFVAPVLSLDAAAIASGHTVNVTFEYNRKVHYAEFELPDMVQTVDYETIQNMTLNEVF